MHALVPTFSFCIKQLFWKRKLLLILLLPNLCTGWFPLSIECLQSMINLGLNFNVAFSGWRRCPIIIPVSCNMAELWFTYAYTMLLQSALSRSLNLNTTLPGWKKEACYHCSIYWGRYESTWMVMFSLSSSQGSIY